MKIAICGICGSFLAVVGSHYFFAQIQEQPATAPQANILTLAGIIGVMAASVAGAISTVGMAWLKVRAADREAKAKDCQGELDRERLLRGDCENRLKNEQSLRESLESEVQRWKEIAQSRSSTPKRGPR